MPKPGYKQSPAHIAKLSKARKGRRDPDAKGWTNAEGYRVVSDGEREVYEHRAVAEKKIGRKLRKGEVVHHGDGKRDDNRPGNVKAMSNGRNVALSNKKRSKH